MYQIGDQVVYGFHGVCRIVDMEKRVVDRKTVRYYVLEPRDHRREKKAAGRKFHLCDENFLRDAEKLICSEVSVVMEIPAEEVPDFLMRQMKTT